METINKRVFVYFGEKEVISTVEQGLNFIKKIGFTPSKQNEETLKDAFSENPSRYTKGNFILCPTGIGKNRINVYHALADNLEEHEIILAKQQEEKNRINKEKQKKAEQEFLEKINTQLRGWYAVTIEYFVIDPIKGGHKPKTLNGRVIANSIQDAYNKGLIEIDNKNGFWAESINRAMIDYIGVLTDEYLAQE